MSIEIDKFSVQNTNILNNPTINFRFAVGIAKEVQFHCKRQLIVVVQKIVKQLALCQ